MRRSPLSGSEMPCILLDTFWGDMGRSPFWGVECCALSSTLYGNAEAKPIAGEWGPTLPDPLWVCRGQSPLPGSEVPRILPDPLWECRGPRPLPGSGVSPPAHPSSPPQAARKSLLIIATFYILTLTFYKFQRNFQFIGSL